MDGPWPGRRRGRRCGGAARCGRPIRPAPAAGEERGVGRHAGGDEDGDEEGPRPHANTYVRILARLAPVARVASCLLQCACNGDGIPFRHHRPWRYDFGRGRREAPRQGLGRGAARQLARGGAGSGRSRGNGQRRSARGDGGGGSRERCRGDRRGGAAQPGGVPACRERRIAARRRRRRSRRGLPGASPTTADAALGDSKVAEDEARTRFQDGQAREFDKEGG